MRRRGQPAPLTPGDVGERNHAFLNGGISTETRKALPERKFAWPEQRKYPIENASHVRNAAARLSGQLKAGRISRATAEKVHARIKAAGKKYGVNVTELDLAPSSVHTDGPMRARPRRVMIRADLADGGALHVRHCMYTTKNGAVCLRAIPLRSGEVVAPESVGVKLIGPTHYSDGEPVRLVWVQLAEVGTWKGHASGAFALTAEVFGQMKANFEKRGIPLMFDFEHVSESDPTEGNLPLEQRTAARGWIHRLDNRGQGGLWALTEWLEPARNMIKKGEAAFLSPAFKLRTVDQVSGQPQGAMLTSAAITNKPFLTGMPGLIAATLSGAGEVLALTHSNTDEFLPHIRACLGLHPMATAPECSEAFGRLCEYHSLGDGKPMHGVDVPGKMRELRDRMREPLTTTDEDLLDKVQAMIDSAVSEHEEKFHDHQLDDDQPDTDNEEPDNDAGAEEMTLSLGETTTMKTAEQLQAELDAANKKISGLEAQVTLLTSQVKAGEDAVKKLNLIEAERAESAVDDAISFYSSTKGLTREQKPTLLKFMQNDPEGFALMYPRVDAKERALALNLTGGRPQRENTVRGEDEESTDGLVKLSLSDTFFSILDKVRSAYPKLDENEHEAKAEELHASLKKAKGH